MKQDMTKKWVVFAWSQNIAAGKKNVLEAEYKPMTYWTKNKSKPGNKNYETRNMKLGSCLPWLKASQRSHPFIYGGAREATRKLTYIKRKKGGWQTRRHDGKNNNNSSTSDCDSCWWRGVNNECLSFFFQSWRNGRKKRYKGVDKTKTKNK